MAKKNGASSAKASPVCAAQERAAKVAQELSFELVEVTLQKESRGKCLCVYVDKEGGITLDDCEKYHKTLQPLLEDIDYDVMEVSSPGMDRPVKTERDFQRNKDGLVEVKLFAPLGGSKLHRGLLRDMDEKTVAIETEDGQSLCFDLKAVAIIKPVIELEEDEPLIDGAADEMEPE